MTLFSAAKIKQFRQQAEKAARVPEETPDGWSKSKVDPAKVLAVFKPLRLKDGFVLRAYQFKEGGNGNGFVWAMPVKAEFPEPGKCPKLKDHFLNPPKPPAALDDVMEAIEGDGSPGSYLCASLAKRQLREFGAMWHGCDWVTHRIVDENPLKAVGRNEDASAMDAPSGKPSEWKWLAPQPKQWSPAVQVSKDSVTVTFYTYSGLGKQAIYRHTDTFKPGSCQFQTQRKEIAQGPGGFVF